jgi:hypothetical protein
MVARVLVCPRPILNPLMLSGVTGGVQENRPSEVQNVAMTVLQETFLTHLATGRRHDLAE